MAYIVRWKWGSHKTPPKVDAPYYPCFAQLRYSKNRYLSVHFLMHGNSDKHQFGEFFDWREDILNGPRFTRIVNYWFELGRRMGFLLNVKWLYDHPTGTFTVIVDTKPIRDAVKNAGKIGEQDSFLKLLKMHLFYIRFLNEVNSVVWFTIRRRTRLKRKYEHLTDTNILILAERHKDLVRKEMDMAEFDDDYDHFTGRLRPVIVDKPTKVGAISLSKYAYYGHELFQCCNQSRQIMAGLKPNPVEEFLSINRDWVAFDTHMWQSRDNDWNTYKLEEECKKVNNGIAEKKTTSV